MTAFYGFELVAQVGVLPPIHASIEAWRARDAGKDVTLLRSRPDIIDSHLRGETYFSNVPQLVDDLESLNMRTPEPGQLKLLAIRRVEDGRIPLAVFEPVVGWPLRDLAATQQLDVPLAAALALQIFRTYAGGANLVRPDGQLARCMLPHFEKVWRSELPSFTGSEPDVSIHGRIREARAILAAVSGHVTDDSADGDTLSAAAAFERELKALAGDVDLGAALTAALV